MPAEPSPHENMSLLGRLLVWVTWAALRVPIATVIIGVAAAAASLYLSQTRLSFRTARADLLNPKSKFNQLWLEYTKQFGDTEDVILVVEGAGPEKVTPVIDELAADLLRDTRYWNTVLYKIDLAKIRSKGLYFLPPEALAGIQQFLDGFAPVLAGDWSQMNLARMAADMQKAAQGLAPGAENAAQAQFQKQAVENQISSFFQSLAVSLSRPGQYQSPWPDMTGRMGDDQAPSRYLLAKQGRMGFIQLRFASGDKDSFTGNKEAVEALGRLVAKVRALHPETAIGITGLPIIEHDEMSSSESSMTIATVLSMAGVMIVVLLGFGGMRHAMLPIIALFLGMTWSLGYTVLTVGHLNILSSAFGAILTGLGINYGIYVVARYLQLRQAGKLIEESLLETAGAVAPGITVGMIATAVSFFMAGFTEFVGVAELGLVAGGGVILCWLAAMTVLPALIYMSDRRHGRILPQPLAFHQCLKPVCHCPRTVLVWSLAGTVLLSLGISYVWYDHNLLHMQAEGLESVAWEQKILTEGDQSASYAISVADSAAALLERKKQFSQLPSVKHIVEIDSILMPDQSADGAATAAKRAIIERISRRLANLPRQAPQIPLASPDELMRLFAGAQAMPLGNSQGNGISQHLQQIGALLQQLPPAEFYARLSTFQQAMANDVLARLYAIRAVANPEPPQLADLPDSLVKRFISPSGMHLMKIYSKGDIWDMDAMREFVGQLRLVDKNVTGNPVQIYEASLQMKRSYEQATWFALCTILPIMFFSLGNLRDTMLAVLPLGLCMLQVFGIMGFLNIPLNAANMISLPLMLGMGVDNGINIIYDFRRRQGRYRMSPSTAVAVILNTLTTMVGFAVLMIASHRGLQGLGRVLTIGMSCCLVSSLVVLPAFLAWITRNAREEEEETPEAASQGQEAAQESFPTTASNEYYGHYPRPAAFADDEPGQTEESRRRASPPEYQCDQPEDEEEILHFPNTLASETHYDHLHRRSA